MNPPPLTVLQIRDFPGLSGNISSSDVPPGGTVTQVNIQTLQQGEMVVRLGFRELIAEAI